MPLADLKFLAGEQLSSQYRQAARLMNEGDQPYTAHADVSRDTVNDGKFLVHIAFNGDLPLTPEGATDWRALRAPLDYALQQIQSPELAGTTHTDTEQPHPA